MKNSLKTGLGFGVTSGVITTLGLIVGLHSGTQSMVAIIGGIVTIAIADALSDSLGIHISKDFENRYSKKEVWEATLTTLSSKFIVALTFMLPLFLLKMHTAIIINIIWGLLLLSFFSFYIAKQKNKKVWPVILEHLAIATLVILITQFVGSWVRSYFI